MNSILPEFAPEECLDINQVVADNVRVFERLSHLLNITLERETELGIIFRKLP